MKCFVYPSMILETRQFLVVPITTLLQHLPDVPAHFQGEPSKTIEITFGKSYIGVDLMAVFDDIERKGYHIAGPDSTRAPAIVGDGRGIEVATA